MLLGSALAPGRALLPADLLVQLEPWRSQLDLPPRAHWDPLVWDGIAQFYPWRRFAAESLRAGVIPLWNPHQFCGTPFLANGQSAVLYPLNVLFWLLSVAAAFAWSAWLHLGLAGWFAYLLLRRAGVGRFGAVSGGMVWQLSGMFVAWVHLPTFLCTAVWLPLALAFAERALTTGRGRYAVASGAALALSGLGGHPQIALFVGLLTGAFVVARAASRAAGPRLRTRAFRFALVVAAQGAIGLGLAAGQLLPTLDLVAVSHRAAAGPIGYEGFLLRSLPAGHLGSLLIPHSFGHPGLGTYVSRENFAEHYPYVGIIALALALLGAAGRRWHARFFALAALITVLLALGTALNWPLYHWAPGYARGGGPVRILLLTVFSLAMLTGLGADGLFRALGRRERRLPAGAACLLVGLLAAAWGWRRAGVGALEAVAPDLGPLASAELARAGALVGAALLAVAAGALARGAVLRRAAQVALVGLLALDLLLASRGHLHIVPARLVYAEAARPQAGDGRIMGNASDWPLNRFPRAVFPPNAAMVYDLSDAMGYDSLYLARYRDFAAMIQHGDPSPPLNGNLLLARLGPSYGLDVLSLAAVTTVVSPTPVAGLELARHGPYYTYQNPHAWPRAWVAASAVFAPTHQEALQTLVRTGPVESCVLITGADEPSEEIPEGVKPAAVVRDLSPNAVAVELPSGGGGYLFLADSAAPGWRAYAGGRSLPVRTAYLTFRAVAPPREVGSVLFRYEPAAFRVGLFVSLVALGVLSMTLGWMAARRGARP